MRPSRLQIQRDAAAFGKQPPTHVLRFGNVFGGTTKPAPW
jgi:hypothetical protein